MREDYRTEPFDKLGRMSAMNLLYFSDRLTANIDVIRGLLTAVSEDQARWKPQPEKWSLLEVINHLADEEAEDFRTRVKLTIENPNQDWPGIDAERWAVERRYNVRDLRESIGRFIRERQMSLAWLSELGDVPWEAAHQHHQFPAIRVGDLIASWLAHDSIHIRQMNRLHFEYLQSTTGPFLVDYAGKW
jgi:hypothetical protein